VALLDLLEQAAQVVAQDQVDLLDLLVHQVQAVHLVAPDHQDQVDQVGLVVLLEQVDHLEHQVAQDQVDHQEQVALLELLEQDLIPFKILVLIEFYQHLVLQQIKLMLGRV
jgi:hypothetical protein